ncbi:hypothetical protein QE152_g25680 [Popillia japonica]|uniref:Uncharacterized protein n=1 Tax=Popillia japonica TaxID=7064 RepID=A0AAW1K0G8_POPJA
MQACGPPPEQRTVPGPEGSGSAQDAQTPAYYPNIEISTTTVGTQTNWDDIELEKAKRDTELRNNKAKRDTELRNNVLEALSIDRGFQNISHALDMDWPSDLFSRTQTRNMNQAVLNSDGNCAILMDPRDVESNIMVDNISMRFPAVLDLAKRNEGHIDFLTSTTATKIRDKEAVEKTTSVYILPLHINKDGININKTSRRPTTY